VESFIQSKGAYDYGGYPDIDDLFLQQARERDPKKREAVLLKIQQLTIDRVMFAAVMDLRALMGIGPRVVKHTITDVWMSPSPSYENIEVKESSAVRRARGACLGELTVAVVVRKTHDPGHSATTVAIGCGGNVGHFTFAKPTCGLREVQADG
jgi:hypothetical protein